MNYLIDFYSYETFKLSDIAEYERAKQGVVYPWGCSTIQISATKGQIGFLETPSTVPTKDVVINPVSGIDRRYFNIIMNKNVEHFMTKYKTGLNIKESEIGNFVVEIHNEDTQQAIVKFWRFIEKSEQNVIDEMNQTIELKNTLLRKMFV